MAASMFLAMRASLSSLQRARAVAASSIKQLSPAPVDLSTSCLLPKSRQTRASTSLAFVNRQEQQSQHVDPTSTRLDHPISLARMPSGKDRLYVALYARGGEPSMSGLEDKFVDLTPPPTPASSAFTARQIPLGLDRRAQKGDAP